MNRFAGLQTGIETQRANHLPVFTRAGRIRLKATGVLRRFAKEDDGYTIVGGQKDMDNMNAGIQKSYERIRKFAGWLNRAGILKNETYERVVAWCDGSVKNMPPKHDDAPNYITGGGIGAIAGAVAGFLLSPMESVATALAGMLFLGMFGTVAGMVVGSGRETLAHLQRYNPVSLAREAWSKLLDDIE